jgi:hypothetical protein
MKQFIPFSLPSTCFSFIVVTYVKTSFCKELQVLPFDENDQCLITLRLKLANILEYLRTNNIKILEF